MNVVISANIKTQMRKILLLSTAVMFTATFLTSCRNTTEKETVVREVEVEKPAEEREGILQRTGKRVDKKVNEEIEQEIESIGDDN